MKDELQDKLLNLRITVWKQTNINGQANLDHDSVNEVMQIVEAYATQRYKEGERAGRIDGRRIQAEAAFDKWRSSKNKLSFGTFLAAQMEAHEYELAELQSPTNTKGDE